MNIVFYILATLMIVAALAVVLVPLVRRGRRNGRPRGIFVLTLVLAALVPLSTIGTYALVGNPTALNAAPEQNKPQMNIHEAIASLQKQLAENPDDLDGWMLLGQTFKTMKKPTKARDAYARARKLAPNNADVLVAWAGADSMARDDHRITDDTRSVLKKALQIDPSNQRGLWLMGISDYQNEYFVDAALAWRRLQEELEPDSDVANAVAGQIAMANARAAGASQQEAQRKLHDGADSGSSDPGPAGNSADVSRAPHAATSGNKTAQAAASPRVAVKVSLSAALQDRIRDGDTLFVFARSGDDHDRDMPLAITRLEASRLPTTVQLTGDMNMGNGPGLGSANTVRITARISHSGDANPQPGDLQGDTGPLKVADTDATSVVIDQTL